ncbi:unnamed protein product [Meganyctiphanes norvegica]|uniref:Ubiquinone biosynthesis protein COQ4 homolog, mitochondrial n=1 Tax=Meganyctiphanes norvegica TaxID=48144 RepID=A0AAV2S3S5_MEGNR
MAMRMLRKFIQTNNQILIIGSRSVGNINIPTNLHTDRNVILNEEKKNMNGDINYANDEESNNNETNYEEVTSMPLYEHHIPTTCIQKSILSMGAAATALLNPWRHDMVAVLGETTGHPALKIIHRMMMEDNEGQIILQEKPRINTKSVDILALSKLPEDTLGYAYFKFLKDNNVTPDTRMPVQYVDDVDLAYVMQRYRESHDLFHTVLGMPTNMIGEVAVKWVEGLQTGLPMCISGAIFGPLRFKSKQRRKYIETYLPWALRVGANSKYLMNIYFERRWEQPLNELRDELGIEYPPEI